MRRGTGASNAATRAASARLDACASTGVRSHTSCEKGGVVFMGLHRTRYAPVLASIACWDHVNGYMVFSILPLSHLYLRNEPTDTLEMRRLTMLQLLELARQSEGGVVIALHVLVIFCQMLKS